MSDSEGITNVPTRKSQHLETGYTKTPKCFSVEQVTKARKETENSGIMLTSIVWLCELEFYGHNRIK